MVFLPGNRCLLILLIVCNLFVRLSRLNILELHTVHSLESSFFDVSCRVSENNGCPTEMFLYEYASTREVLAFSVHKRCATCLEISGSVYSGLANYRNYQLFLPERKASRICLGLHKYVTNIFFTCETRVPSIHGRFRCLALYVLQCFWVYRTSRTMNILVANVFTCRGPVGSQ